VTVVTGDRRSWVARVMGLPVSVHVRHPGPGTAGAVAAVFAALREVDARFSTYRPDSEISRLNTGELSLAGCHPDVREVLDLAARAWRLTGGHFDAMLPGPDGRLRCDPTGLVKGWAVERAAALLAAAGETEYYLNAGGDMVLAAPDGAPPWRVGVEDPAAPDAGLRAVLAVRSGAVATSGTTRRGPHIHHPLTRAAGGGGWVSVTVVGAALTWVDVYATALVAGAGVDVLPAGYGALLIGADGVAEATAGLPLAADR
jgi:thiamine biosynthesis lipoprotein